MFAHRNVIYKRRIAHTKTTKTNLNLKIINFKLFRFLKENPEMQSRYPKLASLHIESPECSEKAFETIASEYLKVDRLPKFPTT